MHPNKKNFVDGLQIILDKWTALQLAIEMEWGGPTTDQKARDLHFSLVDYMEKEGKNVEPEDLEDILLDVMRDEFGAVLEDSSEVEVAKSIYRLFTESVKGQTTFLDEIRRTTPSKSVLDACQGEIRDEVEGGDMSDDDSSNSREP